MTTTNMMATQTYPTRRHDAGGGASTIARRSAGLGGTHARLIGALFLSAFVLYGVGNGLATSAARAAFSAAGAPTASLPLGVLMMLANSAAVVGLGVLLFRLLETHARGTALAY